MQRRVLSQWLAAGACVAALAACTNESTPLTQSPVGGAGGSAAPLAGAGGGAGGAGAGTKATAALAPFGTGTLTGTATFTQTGSDVTVQISVANCPDGIHPVHIHAGTACTDKMTQMTHWGGDGPPQTRGEGIPDITCTGGAGTTMTTRVASANPTLAWAIGGASADANVLNHVVVVHNMDADKTRIGCGQIK